MRPSTAQRCAPRVRWRRYVLASVALLVLVGGGLQAAHLAWGRHAAARPSLSLRAGPVGSAMWGVWTGHSYAYGVEAGPEAVVLIDTGSDPQAQALRTMLTQRGFGLEAVRTIVLTHGGFAQTAGLHHFPQATVWVGAADGVLARRDTLPKPPMQRLVAALLRVPLPKPRLQSLWPGQRLQIGADLSEVVALPGQTPGAVALVVAGWAFVGDSLVGSWAGPVIAGWSDSVSPGDNRRTLGRLGRYSFERVATSRAGLLPWGRDRLCQWLRAQGQGDVAEAPFLDACTATTAGKG